ncbi:PTS transporter subunit EIIB [Varibaculum massiliense]|uniref:PTS transporter subunit EIIB n=1 Tax=Varibaculum massiliense TaxID=1852372 RepID=UPI0008DA5E6C|nr:PTS glucose/sucrose transporter subunit IIB [Varibaculum massiliense]
MEKAKQLLAGLGGTENITEIEPCITRLRVEVKDPQKVDEEVLTSAGALGVVKIDHTVQVVVGPVADELAADMEKLR